MDASPLARLPPELRNRIYERAVALSEPITTLWWPDTEKFSAVRRSRPTRRYPFALAQTCNAIRSETLKLTYNLNDVELRVLDADDAGYEHAVRTFLSAIGPENEAVLRSVTIYIAWWSEADDFIWLDSQKLAASCDATVIPLHEKFARYAGPMGRVGLTMLKGETLLEVRHWLRMVGVGRA